MQEQRTPEEISGSNQNDVSDTSNTLQDSQEECNINSDTQANETEDQESTQSETEERIALKHELKQAWLINFEKYMNIDVKDREFYTKQDRKIPEEELEIVNEIISEHLTELSEAKEITNWHVDVTLYSTAITLLERHGKLKEKKQQRNKYEKPGWQIQFEARISAIWSKTFHK